MGHVGIGIGMGWVLNGWLDQRNGQKGSGRDSGNGEKSRVGEIEDKMGNVSDGNDIFGFSFI